MCIRDSRALRAAASHAVRPAPARLQRVELGAVEHAHAQRRQQLAWQLRARTQVVPQREPMRMQRGQLIGGPQARVPLYVPYADFYQYQAGAGRLADRA